MIDVGAVHYKLGEEAGTLQARWYTSRHPGKRYGTGLAHGDTSQGFAGDYRITYFYPDGSVSAELDLKIEKHGETYDLSYLQDGKLLLCGVGFEVDDGLVGGYRLAE